MMLKIRSWHSSLVATPRLEFNTTSQRQPVNMCSATQCVQCLCVVFFLRNPCALIYRGKTFLDA